ncbi:MAG: hypothetical protein ACRDGB_01165 [Candidatus Limnocylindria bacterium]
MSVEQQLDGILGDRPPKMLCKPGVGVNIEDFGGQPFPQLSLEDGQIEVPVLVRFIDEPAGADEVRVQWLQRLMHGGGRG